MLAAGDAPGAPVLWLWEAAADASQARALPQTLQLHAVAAERSRQQVPVNICPPGSLGTLLRNTQSTLHSLSWRQPAAE